MSLYDEMKKEEEELNKLMGEENEEGTDAGSSEVDEDEGNEGAEEGESEGGDDGEQELSEEGTEGGDGKASERSENGSTEKEIKEEPPKDAAAWARMRRESRELKAKLAALESSKQVQQLDVQKKQDVINTEQEPDRKENPEEWIAWKIKKQEDELTELRSWREYQQKTYELTNTISSAVEEFTAIEKEFREKQSDYGEAAKFARDTYRNAIKVMNPTLTDSQIDKTIDRQILTFAGTCAAKGLNPAEELYDLAIERFGYNPNKIKEEPKKETVSKPNLKVITNNKKRSASPLMGGGQGSNVSPSIENIDDMSLSEFAKLTPSQIREMEEQAYAS